MIKKLIFLKLVHIFESHMRLLKYPIMIRVFRGSDKKSSSKMYEVGFSGG